MHEPNVHATRSKILTPNFVEDAVYMMYFMPCVKFCTAASRDGSISYDFSQLLKRSAIGTKLLF
jgi:hypothetical protein